MSVVLVFLGGGFTWLALYFKTGIIGVAAAVVASTLATGLFYLWVVRNYTPWFGVSRPRITDTRQMLRLSWWFMGWNLVTSLLLVSDVVVLGLLNSIESVTSYSLTKYVPETLIGVIVIIVFGIMPGLGSIIGTGDQAKAARLRDEINIFIWWIATALGASILVWNRIFIGLWVGAEQYSGPIPNLLIVIASMQLVLIRSDGNVIDLTLRLGQKVILGLVSVTISIVAAGIMVGYFKLGVVGLCLGIMAGRLILSVGYPMLISRFLSIPVFPQVIGLLRPILVTLLLFIAAAGMGDIHTIMAGSGMRGWFIFILSASLTGILMLAISFYAGLSANQRRSILRRVRAGLETVESS